MKQVLKVLIKSHNKYRQQGSIHRLSSIVEDFGTCFQSERNEKILHQKLMRTFFIVIHAWKTHNVCMLWIHGNASTRTHLHSIRRRRRSRVSRTTCVGCTGSSKSSRVKKGTSQAQTRIRTIRTIRMNSSESSQVTDKY